MCCTGICMRQNIPFSNQHLYYVIVITETFTDYHSKAIEAVWDIHVTDISLCAQVE